MPLFGSHKNDDSSSPSRLTKNNDFSNTGAGGVGPGNNLSDQTAFTGTTNGPYATGAGGNQVSGGNQLSGNNTAGVGSGTGHGHHHHGGITEVGGTGLIGSQALHKHAIQKEQEAAIAKQHSEQIAEAERLEQQALKIRDQAVSAGAHQDNRHLGGIVPGGSGQGGRW